MSAEQPERFVVEGGVLGLPRGVLLELLGAVLAKGTPFRFQARGHSMHPFLRDGDLLTVAPLPHRLLEPGEVLAFRHPGNGVLTLHRIRELRDGGWLVQGDNLDQPDGIVERAAALGLLVRAERGGREVYRADQRWGRGGALGWLARVWLGRLARGAAATRRAGNGVAPVPRPADPEAGSPYLAQQPLHDLPALQPSGERGRPRGFDLELTARCNCDCRHCYLAVPANDRKARAAELSLAEIDRIAGEAAELGALWCLLTGGEPLLREDFADVYLALKRKGLLVSVFTNATLLLPEHVELFRRYPPRDVEVTVYGATAETYERVTRRPGSFAAFQRGLALLLEGGVKVRLKAMAMRSNAHELGAIADFCRARTKDYFRFDPLLTMRLDGDPARNRAIASERLSAAEIVELERADEQRFQALQKDCDQPAGCTSPTCDHLIHCGAGRLSFSVAADGTFRLCQSLCHPDTTFDLRRGSLRAAWETLVPRVRDMRSRRPEFLESCRSCPLVNLCLWCPAHAHLETGELDARPAYFCEVAHARAAAIKAGR